MSVSSEITRLGNAKTAIASAIAGKGVSVPSGTKLDGMAALIGQISSGGGKTVSQIACGSVSIANNSSGSTNVKLTDTGMIGFTPTHFFAWLESPSTTRYHINSVAFDTQGSSYTRRSSYRGSSAMSYGGNTNNWTTQTAGYLYLSSNNIYIRTSNSYIVPKGTWWWVATGNSPDIT